MPEDYRKVVLGAYRNKMMDGSLSSNLRNPTPGNLREECLIVYREREINSKDDEILRQFFSNVDQEKGYLNVLENSSAEKFKQMPKILKGEVPKPGMRFAELLAWLIDFQPRPSTSYYMSFYKTPQKDDVKIVEGNVLTDDDEKDDTNKTGEKPEINEESDSNEIKIPDVVESIDLVQVIEEKQNKETIKTEGIGDSGIESTFKGTNTIDVNALIGNGIKDPYNEDKTSIQKNDKKKARLSIIFKISISFIMLFIITIAYVFWKKNKDKAIREASATEQCMYWTGLHYEPIACNDWGADKLKITLDKEQLANQQKITMPDTLTAKSIGKVWYGKINSKPEFYTDSGTNPQDTTKRLLPLTEYMLHKYVSYDRYRLEVLIWSGSLLALFGVLLGMAYRYRPKKILDSKI